MKKVFLLGCIVCLSLWTWGQGIDFQKGSFQEALQQAKTGNKLVFVDAFATWCGPCKKMAETVLNQPVVGDYFGEYFISIKIDIEKGEGPILKEKYGIEGIPDYLFLDGDGKLVYRFGGAMSLDKFMEGAKYAIETSHDENNVVRLAMRYEQEKNDEAFLKLYLEKLIEVGSRDSYEVFEQYLKIQKSIRPSSKEMAEFLKDYKDFLVYGGEAERIIQENEKSEEWRLYVRKDIREVFQFFPRLMLMHSYPYAVQKKDIRIIENAVARAREDGLSVSEGEKEDYLIRFYDETRMGEEYKEIMGNKIDLFFKNLDLKKIQNGHIGAVKIREAEPHRKIISSAESYSRSMATTIMNYVKYVNKDAEKKDVLRWAKQTYDILPNRLENMNFYADILYLYGDKQEAIALKEKACQLAVDDEFGQKIRNELDKMKLEKK